MRIQKLRRPVRFVGKVPIVSMALVLATTLVVLPSPGFAQGNRNSQDDGSMDKNEPVYDIVLNTSLPGTSGPLNLEGQIFEQNSGGTTSSPSPVGTAHIIGSVGSNGVAHVQILQDITKRGVLVAIGFLRLSDTPSTTQSSSAEEKLAVVGGTDDFKHVTGELIVTRETTSGGLTLHVEADLKRARTGTRDEGGTTSGTTAGTTSGGTTSGTTSGGTTAGTTAGTTSGGTTSGTTTGGTTAGTTSGGTTGTNLNVSGTTSGTTSGGTTAGTTAGDTTSGTTAGGTTSGGTTAGTTAGGTTGSNLTVSGTTSGGTTSGSTTGTTSGSTTSGASSVRTR